jgi:two-component system, OmpR family, sensor histidine kinase CiaH
MKYQYRLKAFIKTTTARLTLSYLAIIMFMSLGFSLVFYNTSYKALGRQIPAPNTLGFQTRNVVIGNVQGIDEFLRERVEEGRRELAMRLVGLNVLILLGGSVVSYYLARKTLKPIEDNIEAQNQFVSDASHELRTPLTALQTTNEVALRKDKVSSHEAKDVFRHTIDEVMKLRQLTDSLLNLAKTDSGVTDFTLVDISEVVSDALNKVLNTALEKNISVDDKVPKMHVRGNKDSLSQVVTIVLDNAIKYSATDSNIQITAQKDAKYVWLSIKDNGIGIKAVHLPHIFDRFYRADSSRSKHVVEGFGIGLAIAKKIMEQHDGEIIAASTPGKGSTFTLKLPLSYL